MAYKQPSPLEVLEGGTDNTTFTAYSVICAGVTGTGSFQNVSGLGTSGQVLTSTGTSSLASWQASPSGDTNVIFPPLASDLTPADNGRVWTNTTSNSFKGYQNSSIITFNVT